MYCSFGEQLTKTANKKPNTTEAGYDSGIASGKTVPHGTMGKNNIREVA